MSEKFPHLLSPLAVGSATLKNRIMSTGHETNLSGTTISDAYLAYQESRARGGAGLIVLEVGGVHRTAYFHSHCLMVHTDDCIPGYTRMAERLHPHGTTVFAQLFHPGREVLGSDDGTHAVGYAPSEIPNERYKVMPRAMTPALIEDVIDGYARSAERMKRAGLDGVEIVASHGYLPAQFLNPHSNRRTDDWGGGFENRLRFLRETVLAVRQAVAGDWVSGLRISADEMDTVGLGPDEVLDACVALAGTGALDYVNLIAGTSDTYKGAIHIVPPMTVETGYVAPLAARIREQIDVPVFVTGRINDPRIAERIIAEGQADVCGMTRALITDPRMPAKAAEDRVDDIRACIGCNQACIGHMITGYPISCIQYPESGRELEYGERHRAGKRKTVMVVGGGPAGMKAAAVAAERGHDVTLYEAAPRLGGQVQLAQLLPGRDEFGGLVTNLAREVELAQVKVVTGHTVTAELVAETNPDGKRQAPRW
jgi:2,4-dienoyl-CoA reductase-like NADH-dependent reductase (Old Yellow Enzyme family)